MLGREPLICQLSKGWKSDWASIWIEGSGGAGAPVKHSLSPAVSTVPNLPTSR